MNIVTIERDKYTVHYPKNYLKANTIGTISIIRVTVLVDRLKNLGSDRILYASDGIILEAPVPAVQADNVDLRLLTVFFQFQKYNLE